MMIDEMIAYERGELDDLQIIYFFSKLIKSKWAWKLQGHYGRTATYLIEEGFLTNQGNVTDKLKKIK